MSIYAWNLEDYLVSRNSRAYSVRGLIVPPMQGVDRVWVIRKGPLPHHHLSQNYRR
jgi:hypothetical protein